MHPGRVDQPRRQADRAGIERRLDLARPSPPARRRSAARASAPRTDAADACRGRPGTRRSGRAAARSTASRYSANGPPARRQAVRRGATASTRLAADVGDRRERVAAVPRELGREALVQVAGQRPVDEERAVRVAVRIDEPRRDDPAGRRRARARPRRPRPRREVAHGQDPVAEDADVGSTPRAPRPVDHGPAAQQQVEAGHVGMVPRSRRDRDRGQRASG